MEYKVIWDSSWETTFGLINYPLRDLANQPGGDGTYRVIVVPFVDSDGEDQLSDIMHLMGNRYIVDAAPQGDRVVFVRCGAFQGWHAHYKAAGIDVFDGKNHGKHTRILRSRLTEIGIVRDRYARIYMEPDAWTDEDTSTWSQDQKEMLVDGSLAVSRDLVAELIQERVGHSNPLRDLAQRNALRGVLEWSFRDLSDEGLLKGHALVMAERGLGRPGDGTPMPYIISPLVNLKKVVKFADMTKAYTVMQPKHAQSDPKMSANANIMLNAMRGRMQLYTDAQLSMIMHDHLQKARQEIEEGVIGTALRDTHSSAYEKARNLDVLDAFTSESRWSVLEAAMGGLDWRKSPALTRAAANGYWSGLIDSKGHPRFVMPNAVMAAVKTESMMRMAGYWVKVPRGHITHHELTGVWVVNDFDFVQDSFHLNGGTPDGDDYWYVIATKFTEGYRMMIFRLPMDSYMLFETDVDGIPYEWADGSVTNWWDMGGSLTMLPPMLSDLVDSGKVTVKGLPSQSKPAASKVGKPLTRATTRQEIQDVHDNGSAIGVYTNALHLYILTFGHYPPVILGSLSDIVDATDPDDIEAAQKMAFAWVRDVVLSGKPISRAYWTPRRRYFASVCRKLQVDVNTLNFTTKDKMSRERLVVDDEIKKFKVWEKAFGQANHALWDPDIVHYTTDQDLAIAHRLVRLFRGDVRAAYQEASQFGEEALTREQWIGIFSNIMDAIESRPEGPQRNSMIAALMVRAHNLPTIKFKEFNDNFICRQMKDETGDKAPWPYVMQFLRDTGIAIDDFRVVGDKVEPVYAKRAWAFRLTCPECGLEHRTTNIDAFWRWVEFGGYCRNCR